MSIHTKTMVLDVIADVFSTQTMCKLVCHGLIVIWIPCSNLTNSESKFYLLWAVYCVPNKNTYLLIKKKKKKHIWVEFDNILIIEWEVYWFKFSSYHSIFVHAYNIYIYIYILKVLNFTNQFLLHGVQSSTWIGL